MSHQASSSNKRPRETDQGGDDGVILRETTERSETHHVINIIRVDKASSSSPFRSYKPGHKDARVIRRERPKSYPHSVGDDNVVGIEEDVEKLVQQLINPQSRNFLGIVGMGGSGKTTLARKIYNHEKISQYFHRRVWISVSQVWSEESILKEIFSQTTKQNSDNLTPTQIVQEMHELLEGKSYLVVLDDVWEPDVLMQIMVPTSKPRGSKFVITTRNQKVIQFSDLHFDEHNPRRLTDDQSLELFRKIAFDHQSNRIMARRNGSFMNLAEKMLKKCEGLPLAVTSLAGLLRTKNTIQEWNKVSENVSSKIITNDVGPSDYGRVEEMLGLSYSDLNYTMKSCFMYLSLFPEDEEIPCGMLMRCWIAEGFFKSVWLEENESIEDVARKCLDELIQRCLVQVAKVNYDRIAKRIKVHDLLRDLAIRKAKVNYFSSTFPSNPPPKPIMQCLRLWIYYNNSRGQEKILEDKVSRHLRSFIYWSSSFEFVKWREIHLETFLTNYSLLRVLVLVDVKNIPDVIGSLIHLRSLQLIFVPCLPDSIQNLRNLLSFDCRYINKVPIEPISIPNLKQMKQLRYLHLPLVDEYKGPVHLRDLQNLKVLKGIKSGEWIMKELKYLSPTVEKLKITGIEKSEELEQVYECPNIVEDHLYSLSLDLFYEVDTEFKMQKLQHCKNLQKLFLKGEIATITGVPFVFPPNLHKLHLVDSQIHDEDSFACALQRLTWLKVLELNDDAYVGADLTFPANSLLNLETLELRYLGGLERINVMEGAMPDLKSVTVDECYQLEVPQRFRDCDNFSIIVDNWKDHSYDWEDDSSDWEDDSSD